MPNIADGAICRCSTNTTLKWQLEQLTGKPSVPGARTHAHGQQRRVEPEQASVQLLKALMEASVGRASKEAPGPAATGRKPAGKKQRVR